MSHPALSARRDAFLARLGGVPLVMGVLNVTPDSFSDGGRHYGAARAAEQTRRMIAEGAAIVDVGAESTRPGHTPLSENQELARIEEHLPAVMAAAGETPVSIDTSKAAVARRACALGACVVNDVWGLQHDPAMADAVAETGAALVAMHNRAEKDESLDIVADMRRFFDRTLGLCAKAGIAEARVILDPGVGFGKTPEQNLACVARLPELADYGLPFLVGMSRKSFIARLVGGEKDERLAGTLGAHFAAIEAGAGIVRAHDVRAHVEAITIYAAVRAAGRR